MTTTERRPSKRYSANTACRIMSHSSFGKQSKSNVTELMLQEFDTIGGGMVGLADAASTDEAKDNGRWLVMDSEHVVNAADMA